MFDSIVQSMTDKYGPYALSILAVIAITWATGKTVYRISKGKLEFPAWLNSSLPLLIGVAWEAYHGTSLTGWLVWKAYLVKGLILGAISTSLYDLVLKKVVQRGDEVADTFLDKILGKVDTSGQSAPAPVSSTMTEGVFVSPMSVPTASVQPAVPPQAPAQATPPTK